MRISDWSSDVCSSDLQPVFTILTDARFVAGPPIGISCAAAIQDAEFHFFPGRTRQPEIKPLMKVAVLVLYDLQIGAVARNIEDADIAAIEGAGDRERDRKSTRLNSSH